MMYNVLRFISDDAIVETELGSLEVLNLNKTISPQNSFNSNQCTMITNMKPYLSHL